jgi:uncharacterized DUF497 family protein
VIIEFDIAKNVRNVDMRGLPFTAALGFRIEAALVRSIIRDGEARWVAIGMIGEREFVLVFTGRGARFRVISLRKANSRERKLFNGR